MTPQAIKKVMQLWMGSWLRGRFDLSHRLSMNWKRAAIRQVKWLKTL